MPARRELSAQLRSRLCELKSYGLTYAQIYRAHPEIPRGTIRTTIYREHHRVDNKTKPRSGRPRKITEEERDHLLDLTTSNPHIKYKDLVNEVDAEVSKRTVRRLFQEMRIRNWQRRQQPLLKPEHAQKRLISTEIVLEAVDKGRIVDDHASPDTEIQLQQQSKS